MGAFVVSRGGGEWNSVSATPRAVLLVGCYYLLVGGDGSGSGSGGESCFQQLLNCRGWNRFGATLVLVLLVPIGKPLEST